jgi:hypothetical protein
MDWTAAVERHHESLKRILAALFAMAGLADGALAENTTLPRRLYRTLLRLLRPAEAAVRRLVIIAARDVTVTVPPLAPSVKTRPGSLFVSEGGGTGVILPPGVRPDDLSPAFARPDPAVRPLSFPLLDPLRRPRPPQPHPPATRSMPRISLLGVTVPAPLIVRPRPTPDDPIGAMRLTRRLQLLGRVLDDLPKYARRFARWRARCQARLTRRLWPLRPGRPPGGRSRPSHEIDDVLAALQGLAFDTLEHRDTS